MDTGKLKVQLHKPRKKPKWMFKPEFEQHWSSFHQNQASKSDTYHVANVSMIQKSHSWLLPWNGWQDQGWLIPTQRRQGWCGPSPLSEIAQLCCHLSHKNQDGLMRGRWAMALICCINCGHLHSGFRHACPMCGVDPKTSLTYLVSGRIRPFKSCLIVNSQSSRHRSPWWHRNQPFWLTNHEPTNSAEASHSMSC